MRVRQAYNQWSANYNHDRNLTRDLDAQVTRTLLNTEHYPAILELGCGTGKNTTFLSEIGETIVGFDFSEGMLGQARGKSYTTPVAFGMADLTHPLPCRSEWADLVTCNLVLEHLPDLGPIFSEVRRVLAPKGRFLISELHPFKQYQGKKAVFDAVEIPAYQHHVSDFWQAAHQAGLSLIRLDEWWHDEDADKPPRLISFLFERV